MLSTSKLLLFTLIILTIARSITSINSRASSDCIDWYAKQIDPEEHLQNTLKPPCQVPTSFPAKLIDGWLTDPGCDASKWPKATCGYHEGAHGCYRHSFKSTGPGAQACYDQDGSWLSDPWRGAGTLDVETPLGSLFQQLQHYTTDVKPYDDCCKTSSQLKASTCSLYYEKRPPGQCEDKLAV